MSTLNSFISDIKNNGLARQNRFTVDIGRPQGLPNFFNELNKVHLFCEQAVLPGIALSTQPVRTFGENREMVYDRNFENVTLTFLVDSNMLVKKLFDDWMDIIVDPNTRLIGYYDQYVANMNIKIQDIADNTTYECELRGAYPKSIQAITLDNNSKDIMKLSVTFAYKNHFNRNWATSSSNALSDQNIPKNIDGTILQGYQQTAISIDSTTNELYYSNFQEYQQRINDNASYSKAIMSLERQDIQTDLGGLYQ